MSRATDSTSAAAAGQELIVRAKVIERPSRDYATPQVPRTVAVKCVANERVRDLRRRLRELLPHSIYPKSMHIAFRGLLLADNDRSLFEYGLVGQQQSSSHPVVFVTFVQLDRMVSAAGYTQTQAQALEQDEQEQEEQPEEQEEKNESSAGISGGGGDEKEEEEERMCRLCYSSEESDLMLGRLFSPCRCSIAEKLPKNLRSWRRLIILIVLLTEEATNVTCC